MCNPQQLTVSEGSTHAARTEPRAPVRASAGAWVVGCSPLRVPSYSSLATTRLYREHMESRHFWPSKTTCFDSWWCIEVQPQVRVSLIFKEEQQPPLVLNSEGWIYRGTVKEIRAWETPHLDLS